PIERNSLLQFHDSWLARGCSNVHHGIENHYIHVCVRQVDSEGMPVRGSYSFAFAAESLAELAEVRAEICESLLLVHVGPQHSGQPVALNRPPMPQDEQSQQPMGFARPNV